MLGPLADNGGLTETIKLLAGSPAVNRIPRSALGCGTTITFDQRNFTRPVGVGCDVGAYEDASAPVQLAYLLAAVTNVGPGASFADKVKLIQRFVSSSDTRNACAALLTLIDEAKAQNGKKLTPTQAAGFTAEASSIQMLLNC
jgi:hypothetical protein